MEVDRETRKETCRVVPRLVRNRSSRTLTRLVRSIVRPGTTVVTDEWRGYNGLSKAGYKHDHRKNQKVNAEGLGTNPVEGLVFQGSAILAPALCQRAFVQEIWIAACGVFSGDAACSCRSTLMHMKPRPRDVSLTQRDPSLVPAMSAMELGSKKKLLLDEDAESTRLPSNPDGDSDMETMCSSTRSSSKPEASRGPGRRAAKVLRTLLYKGLGGADVAP